MPSALKKWQYHPAGKRPDIRRPPTLRFFFKFMGVNFKKEFNN
jgi:hypothetical protein